jgi:hypothetical protein
LSAIDSSIIKCDSQTHRWECLLFRTWWALKLLRAHTYIVGNDSQSSAEQTALHGIKNHTHDTLNPGLQASDAKSGSSNRGVSIFSGARSRDDAGTGMGVRGCDKYINLHSLARGKKK